MPRLLRCLVVLLGTFALASVARAQGAADESYRAADRAAVAAYRKGDLESAREAWERCLADPALAGAHEERGRVLYDLGNVAYRQKKLLEAVGWYTAALRERPRDADTWANLEQARSEAHLEPEDRGDLLATLERLFTALTPEESRWLALAATLVWGLVLAGEAFFGGRSWAWIARLATLALLVLLVPWQIHSWRGTRDEWLVTSTQPLALASEPRADAAHLGELAPGARVRRLDELPEWDQGRRRGRARGLGAARVALRAAALCKAARGRGRVPRAARACPGAARSGCSPA